MAAKVYDGYWWGLHGKPQTKNPWRLTTADANLHWRWLREWHRDPARVAGAGDADGAGGARAPGRLRAAVAGADIHGIAVVTRRGV